ncbi:hypothetical protein F5888DRAFT_531513 [Russula emetica]|nr:hypothetical protein F5888DRAFT_531513 [Russula emetica]
MGAKRDRSKEWVIIMHDISIGGGIPYRSLHSPFNGANEHFVLVLQKETLMRVLVRLVGIRNSNDHRKFSELFASATGNRISVIYYCETVKRTTCFCNGLQYLGVVAFGEARALLSVCLRKKQQQRGHYYTKRETRGRHMGRALGSYQSAKDDGDDEAPVVTVTPLEVVSFRHHLTYSMTKLQYSTVPSPRPAFPLSTFKQTNKTTEATIYTRRTEKRKCVKKKKRGSCHDYSCFSALSSRLFYPRTDPDRDVLRKGRGSIKQRFQE